MARSAGSVYGRALFDNQGMLATWLPDRPLRVGDIVSRDSRTGILTVEATLAKLAPGTRHAISSRTGPAAVTLQRGATIDFVATTGIPGASAALRFTAESSFIFAARTGSTEEYRHSAPLREALLALAAANVWRNEWQIVTTVRRFAACTIVIARESGTTARIALDPATALTGTETIAAATGVSITSGDASLWELTDAGPLYEALTVRRNFLTGSPGVSSGGFMDFDLGLPDEYQIVPAGPGDLELP